MAAAEINPTRSRLAPLPPMNCPANIPSQVLTQREACRQLLIQRLRGKIRRVETAGRNDDGSIVSSGSADIDNLLPAGGYNRGTVIEWLADPGSGAEFLSLLVARNAAEHGGALVIIDQHNQFHPPAARAIGINLGNLIVLRSNHEERVQGVGNRLNSQEDFCWAIDQALRCPAVAAVWGALPDFETPQSATRWLRRFQLSAESSGCLGLFIRGNLKGSGTNCAQHPAGRSGNWFLTPFSSSEIQWRIQPQPGSRDARRMRTSLVRCRGGTVGRFIDLEINTITGNVRQARCEHENRTRRQTHSLPVAAQLANPATGRRAERA